MRATPPQKYTQKPPLIFLVVTTWAILLRYFYIGFSPPHHSYNQHGVLSLSHLYRQQEQRVEDRIPTPPNSALSPIPRLVDCFTFNSESDMLEFRLKTLTPVVDVFVIVEANSTFSGKSKSLTFLQNKERFTDYLPKIMHVVVEDSPNLGDAWENERFQRDALIRGLQGLKPPLRPSDLIVGSDVDEVPDPRTLLTLKEHGALKGVYAFSMDFYYYSFRFRKTKKWDPYPKIVDAGTFLEDKGMTFSKLRSDSSSPVLPLKGGWHLSYFGGVEFIQNKLESFSHQEYNNDQYKNAQHIVAAMESGEDLFGRPSQDVETIELIENDYLPKYYEMVMPRSK